MKTLIERMADELLTAYKTMGDSLQMMRSDFRADNSTIGGMVNKLEDWKRIDDRSGGAITRCIGMIYDEIAARMSALDKIDGLPVTEDGVPILPDDRVWFINDAGVAQQWACNIALPGRCWSTRELAEAAR